MMLVDQSVNFDSVSPNTPSTQTVRFPSPSRNLYGQTFQEESRKRKTGYDRLPLDSEDHGYSIAGKTSPLIAEKLWEGPLQLSTSTTVSAVAFFKCGEKAQNFKWPKHVEIKGKVRLQEFENFIQELPRSRSRALMVISLCLKPGFLEAGLTGMKEVAKGYMETQRVGVAKICSGYNLYVCPQSDTVITVLAKYGFFKGMAALEDDQNSLVGCFIWRRGHVSTTKVPKILQNKKIQVLHQETLNLPEPSVSEINSSAIWVDDLESKQRKAPNPVISALDSIEAAMAEHKDPHSSKKLLNNSGSFNRNSVSELSPPVPYKSPLVPVKLLAMHEGMSSLQEPKEHTITSVMQVAESPKHDGGTEQLNLVLTGQPAKGIQQQPNTQMDHELCNFDNCSSGAPPSFISSVSLESTLVRAQSPMTQTMCSSCRQSLVQNNSRPESAHLVLPGSPPLTPDILHMLIQYNKDLMKAITKGVLKNDASGTPTDELKKPIEGSEAEKKPADLDDDGDLPEFDFDSAIGVIETAAVSRFPESSHQTKFQFCPSNQRVPVHGNMNEHWPRQPLAVKSLEFMDLRQAPESSSFHGRNLNLGQSTSTAKFLELSYEKKPSYFLSIRREFPGEYVQSSSSSNSFARKGRWEDDGDEDMPEWLPPYIEHVNVKKPHPATNVLRSAPRLPPLASSSVTTSHPPHRQSFSHGYRNLPVRHYPANVNLERMHHRSRVSSNLRSALPYSDHSMAQRTSGFRATPPVLDVRW